MRILVVLLVVALSTVPTVLAVPPQSIRYAVGSSHVDVAGLRPSGPCGGDMYHEGQQLTPTLGGICDLDVLPGEPVTIGVLDDVFGAEMPYSVWFLNVHPVAGGGYTTSGCGPSVRAVGSVDVVVPDGCYHMSVRLDTGATTGTIALS